MTIEQGVVKGLGWEVCCPTPRGGDSVSVLGHPAPLSTVWAVPPAPEDDAALGPQSLV